MRRNVSISLKQVVALNSVCLVAGVARSSVYWSRQTPSNPAPEPRPARGPVGRYSDAELVTQIRLVLAATAFLGEGYRKLWAKLRHRGIRTSDVGAELSVRQHALDILRGKGSEVALGKVCAGSCASGK